jgi:hypothetical protein
VQLDRKAITFCPGVCQGNEEVLLASGRENIEAWRAVLDDLIGRGLNGVPQRQRPTWRKAGGGWRNGPGSVLAQ